MGEIEIVLSHICGKPGWAFILKANGKSFHESAHIYRDESSAFNAAREELRGPAPQPVLGRPRLIKRSAPPYGAATREGDNRTYPLSKDPAPDPCVTRASTPDRLNSEAPRVRSAGPAHGG